MDSLKFTKIWNENQGDFLKLLSIPSMYDETTADSEHPYGASVYDALSFMKDHCQRIGLYVQVYDNTSMSASIGTGERIDLVSHLDVVAPGDGWDSDPFDPQIKDGYIIARGSQDMKSGAWMMYLVLKTLLEEGYVFPKEVRLVYGTDEERTMDDMRNYVKHAGLPAFAMTPDGQFPVIIGEKGALMWTMEKPYTGKVRSMHAGVQPNVVPPQADAVLDAEYAARAEEILQEEGIRGWIRCERDSVRIHTDGAPAHASTPWKGHSAAADLLKILWKLTGEEDLERIYHMSAGMYGEGCGIECDIPPMGRLTLNPGILTIENGMFHAMLDSRYPYGITAEELDAQIRNHFPDFRIELPYVDPPTLVGEDDPYLTAVKEAYREVLHEDCGTYICGGVSYTKVFGHCVCFGPVAQRHEKVVHQRNEKIRISDCIEALAVYYETIKKLMEVGK